MGHQGWIVTYIIDVRGGGVSRRGTSLMDFLVVSPLF